MKQAYYILRLCFMKNRIYFLLTLLSICISVSSARAGFGDLPSEVKKTVAKNLDKGSLLSLSVVNKSINRELKDDPQVIKEVLKNPNEKHPPTLFEKCQDALAYGAAKTCRPMKRTLEFLKGDLAICSAGLSSIFTAILTMGTVYECGADGVDWMLGNPPRLQTCPNTSIPYHPHGCEEYASHTLISTGIAAVTGAIYYFPAVSDRLEKHLLDGIQSREDDRSNMSLIAK
jgi:hypothetical protein